MQHNPMVPIINTVISDYSVGIDCEDIQRWRKMLGKLEIGPRRKLFTESEHNYCRSFKDPAPHYAARWCAKEALVKAIYDYCPLDLRTIEIASTSTGAPFYIVKNPNFELLKPVIKLSMTHSRETAMAVAIVIINKLSI